MEFMEHESGREAYWRGGQRPAKGGREVEEGTHSKDIAV